METKRCKKLHTISQCGIYGIAYFIYHNMCIRYLALIIHQLEKYVVLHNSWKVVFVYGILFDRNHLENSVYIYFLQSSKTCFGLNSNWEQRQFPKDGILAIC